MHDGNVHDSIHHGICFVQFHPSAELQIWGFRTKNNERLTGETEEREKKKKKDCMIFNQKILFIWNHSTEVQ